MRGSLAGQGIPVARAGMNERGGQQQHRQQDEGGCAEPCELTARCTHLRGAMIWMRAIHIAAARSSSSISLLENF